MNHPTDQQLLGDYAAHQSDAAFAELVRRHIGLVYSAALRMVCDAHLAEDVTQGAFVALAKNARQLAAHPVLSGWLHRTARNLAANTVRSEARRRAREQEAAAMNGLLAAGTDAAWGVIAPHLDAALGELNDMEHDAVLLRYFEGKSARDMAGILGTSEDAAQKRVSRAVERLRELLSKRNVTVGANSLAARISANAVQSAPAALMKTALAAALAKGATAGGPALALARGASHFMTWKTKASIVAGAIVLLAAGTVVLSEGWLKKPPAVEAGDTAQIMVTTAFVTTTVTDADAILRDFSKPRVPPDPSSRAFRDLIARHPKATIAAAPRVVTLNGNPATMSVTRAVEINGARTNIGVTLDVTPTIEAHAVALKVRAELRELTHDTPPAIRLTTVEHDVKLPSGDLVELRQEIPDTITGQTNSLLVFISPRILDARDFNKSP